MEKDKVIDLIFEFLKSKTEIKVEIQETGLYIEYKFYLENNIIIEIIKNNYKEDSINTYAIVKGEKYYLHFWNNNIDREDVAMDIVKKYM